MNKKTYTAPNAELLMLVPTESLAAPDWLWGVYTPTTQPSATVGTTKDIWENSWNFSQNDESYKTN